MRGHGLHVVRELTKDGRHLRDLGNPGVPSDSGFEQDVWRRNAAGREDCSHRYTFDKGWSFWMGLQTIKRGGAAL